MTGTLTFVRPKQEHDVKSASIDSRGNLLLFAKNKQPLRIPRRHLKDLRWLLDQPRK